MNPTSPCRHLRTKKMFIPAQADELRPTADDRVSDPPHCWCNRTLTETGPDDRQVGMGVCSNARSCFEA